MTTRQEEWRFWNCDEFMIAEDIESNIDEILKIIRSGRSIKEWLYRPVERVTTFEFYERQGFCGEDLVRVFFKHLDNETRNEMSFNHLVMFADYLLECQLEEEHDEEE